MSEPTKPTWATINGYGQPAHQLLRYAVVACLRAGNYQAATEIRVAPGEWEETVVTLGEHRPVDIEFVENTAVVKSWVAGRRVRIVADQELSEDVLLWRAAP